MKETLVISACSGYLSGAFHQSHIAILPVRLGGLGSLQARNALGNQPVLDARMPAAKTINMLPENKVYAANFQLLVGGYFLG